MFKSVAPRVLLSSKRQWPTGGRHASVGLGTHHRAVGPAVDWRRLRPPL